MPVEYSATWRCRPSSTPTNWRTSCARLIAVSRSSPLIRPMYETSPTPVMSGIRQSCSGMYPIRSRPARPSPISRPRTLAVPAVGRRSLRRSRKNVVLPAPFGPTRPIAPSGIDRLRSSTARTSPKTFVKPAVWTRAIIASSSGPSALGRSGLRYASLDSSLPAPPQDHEDQDGDHDRDGDVDEEVCHAQPGRRPGTVRVRLEAHLRRWRAILVIGSPNVEADIVREERVLVPGGGTARDSGEDAQRSIQHVRCERARFHASGLLSVAIATPPGRNVR